MVAGLEYRDRNHIEEPLPHSNSVGFFLRAERSSDDVRTGGFKFSKRQERIALRADERFRRLDCRVENYVQVSLTQQFLEPPSQGSRIGAVELRLVAQFLRKIAVTEQDIFRKEV